MTTFETIVARYNEFNSFLQSIDLEELRKQHTRHELNELASKVSNFNLRSLSYDIRKITEEMKFMEYPELLGVHRYPVLKQITFLTDEQKLELDKYLAKHRVGEYVSNLWRIARSEEKAKLIREFLVQNKVVEVNYYGICPNCMEGLITDRLNTEAKEKIDAALAMDSNSDERCEFLWKVLHHGCMECDDELDQDRLTRLEYKKVYRMVMERDKSLDKV